MADLPTADQFFGPATKGGLPSADEFFGKAPTESDALYASGDASAVLDHYFEHTAPGRLLGAAGQGVANGWGAEPLGVGQETEDFLRKSGVWNDYKNGQTSLVKAFNEAFMRPAAAGLDALMRGTSALFGGGQAGVAQIGVEVGAPRLGREIAAMPEAFFGSPGGLRRPPLPQEIAHARSLGVIGEGEAGWKGTAEPTPETEAARADAIKAQHEAVTEATPPTGAPETPEAAPAEPVPDIHAIARQIAPQTFQEYDTLSARRDTLRRRLDDLKGGENVRATEDQIDTLRGRRLEEPNAAERRHMANRITEMETERDRLADELKTGADTDEMAAIRRQIQEADYRMRDLAPDVSAAYRAAQEPGVEQPRETPAAPEPAEAPVPTPAPEAAPEPTPTPAPRAIAPDIAADVSGKLVAAGRPQEEADAAAALIAEHYRARADRFGGAKGTPEELYAAEAPDIRAAEEGRKGAAGKTELADARSTITLFGKADASTFIHETGHGWLNELLKDAADEQAPADLKADADVVRGWLGTEADAAITTRQHEKFARGFERYMMEGRAPSQALADVFGKFKDWLTAIYQTVGRLRSPITDDIRGVFDRFLATPGEHPVITPEREATPVERRVAEVEATPPHRASEVADQVRQEVTDLAREKAPEVHNELTGGGAAEAPGGPPAGEPAGGNAAAPEPVAGEPGTAQRPGAALPSGGAVAPQGVDVLERPKPEPAPDPTRPNQSFGVRESALVDKAGNIRLDNLNTPESVNQGIREAAATNNDFMTERRGIISDAEVLNLAEALGMDAAKLNRRQIGQAYNAEEVVAARKLLVQSATAVRDAAAKAAAGSEDDLMAFVESVTRLEMIQGQVAGITAEAGRALRAFHALEGGAEAREIGELLKQSVGRTLYQMKQKAQAIANLPSPGQVAGYVQAASKPGVGAMLLEVFKNWLISGPFTHSTYAIGNALLALYKAVPETAAEATVGLVREAIAGQPVERVRFGEVGAQLYAMVKGQRDGWMAAWDSLKAGQTQALPHEILDSATKAERARYDQLRAGGATHDQALSHMGIQPQQAATPFTNTQAVPNFTVAGIPIPLGSIVRGPGERMVAPIHSYFRTIGYLQSIARQAYRIAADEGLAGTAFEQRIATLTRDPTEEMMEEARGSATQQTLMGRGGELTRRVSAFVNWEPNVPLLGPTKPLAFVDPFVHIAANIVEQSVLQRGPAGLMAEQLRNDMLGRNGGLAQDTAIARITLGTSLSVVGMGLAAESLLTPSAPEKPEERAWSWLVNGQPHALRIGDLSFDISRLGVLGLQMGVAADLYHIWDRIGKDDASKIAGLLVHSFAQNFLEEGFMRGPSDMIKAVHGDDPQGHFVRNFVTSITLPYSVGVSQLSRQIDPFAREARSLLDDYKAKIPWLSESLPQRYDVWGQPILNREFWGVYEQRVRDDPTNRVLTGLGVFPSLPERKIVGVELTGQQFADYSRMAGQLAKTRLDAYVPAPWFSSVPRERQIDMIKDTIKQSRDTVRELIKIQATGTSNDIRVKAVQAKVDRLKK